MTIAHFPFVRTLEGFEFEAQPSIDPGKIRDLGTCRWVANGDNVVLLGPPGVGKTHLEVALGREAVARGYTAQFTTAMELIGALVKAQQQGTLEMRLAQYAKPKLLIIDKLGYLPLEPAAGHLFFQLISKLPRPNQGGTTPALMPEASSGVAHFWCWRWLSHGCRLILVPRINAHPTPHARVRARLEVADRIEIGCGSGALEHWEEAIPSTSTHADSPSKRPWDRI